MGDWRHQRQLPLKFQIHRATRTRDKDESTSRAPVVTIHPQPGNEVAKYLPNSCHVIVPQAGHGMDGLSDAGCVDRLIIEFMDKENALGLDTTCVDRMAAPPFAISATK